MKTFVFVVEKRPDRKKNNRLSRIYRIVRNTPKYLGYIEYTSGSSRGDESEVFGWLMDNGFIPKSYRNLSSSGWCGAGYYCQSVEDKGYKIIQLY